MIDSGYILIERTGEYLRKYLQHPDTKKYESQILRLRKLFDFLNFEKYQGVGKTIFDSFPYYSLQDTTKKVKELVNNPSECDNIEARRNLAHIEFTDTDFNGSDKEFYFKSLSDANNTYELIDNKNVYEIISVDWSNDKESKKSTLGYDIGSLGYSIICDTCIAPIWHPPDFNDMDEILEFCKKLNTNCLFDNYKDAFDFNELYEKKEWGEKGNFDIFRIDKIE